ncbi:Dps family protein [Wenjunlia tyrosinilytica]|uniref:DNA starvation/stationary phase protection protein n=1 Tax=Wenjunlia tyrosinilytica TaxID=1544741 RepID=A0A918E021_9ACTN|nr:DNA starvation/stationary phase protection protein [Wenjunlia tyrosinilytica]GGO91570.1 DNA starvation/stationary phase protection protein [Wenjunlia tyrosinilytica]
MTVVKSALSEDARKVTGDALQGALVDLLDLSLVAKQAHWNLVGPRFRSIHLQLDEVVATARTYSDTVAERAAALGVPPDGRAETVAKTSGLPSAANGWIKDKEAIKYVIEAFAAIIGRMRERIEATEKPDPVTQDIFIGLTAELEKAAWMFQAENHA